MASRRIEDLHPKVAELCRKFIDECDKAGIDVIITSTYRSHAEQNALYAQGRTKPGKKITNAQGGDSYHNWRLAFDFAPVVNGKIDWNDLSQFKRCGAIAESIGLEWGGSWRRFKDYPHCQYTQGLTIAQLKAGRTIDETETV